MAACASATYCRPRQQRFYSGESEENCKRPGTKPEPGPRAPVWGSVAGVETTLDDRPPFGPGTWRFSLYKLELPGAPAFGFKAAGFDFSHRLSGSNF
jgi:hypothetical protein